MPPSPIRPDSFHAIADPTRRRILELLRDGEKPAGEIVEAFDVTFAAVSQHLKILLDCGLVARRSEGRHRLYSMRPENLLGVHEWTEGFRDFWEGRLGKLTDFLDSEK